VERVEWFAYLVDVDRVVDYTWKFCFRCLGRWVDYVLPWFSPYISPAGTFCTGYVLCVIEVADQVDIFSLDF
jgi:hypothetical protein